MILTEQSQRSLSFTVLRIDADIAANEADNSCQWYQQCEIVRFTKGCAPVAGKCQSRAVHDD